MQPGRTARHPVTVEDKEKHAGRCVGSTFAVGENLHPGAERASVEGSNETQDPSVRGHMAGHSLGRIDDSLLVREAQRGNRAAFEELVRHYDQAVLRLAMHLTGSGHEAQDIYQDAF